MPKNKLANQIIKKLKVYSGSIHPHIGSNPKNYLFNIMSDVIYATGRRKSATARVYLYEGSGNILINDLPLEEYFGREVAKILVKQPLKLLNCDQKFDIKIKVSGGVPLVKPVQ